MFRHFLALVFAGGALLFPAAFSVAGAPVQTNAPKQTAKATPSIKTQFVDNAKLTPAEVKQVVTLAKKCGMHDTERVATMNCIPVGPPVIEVESKERVAGRSVSYDYVIVNKIGWGPTKPDPKSERIGNFWVSDASITTVDLREYQIKTNKVRVGIGKGVDVAIADKVIPLIAEGKVQFPDEWNQPGVIHFNQFKNVDTSKPTSISREAENEYEVDYENNTLIHIKWDKGKVIVTSVGRWVI